MSKTIKRLLSMVVAMVMVVGMIPMSALAETGTVVASDASGELTPAEIVAAAYALESGESLDEEYTLTGEITSINAAYDDYYNNITVEIVVEGCEGYPIVCYRLTGDDTETLAALAVTDTITVTGTLTNYYGTIEFAQGCTLGEVVKGEGLPEAEPADATITFDDTAKRTTFTTEQQVWEENGIMVTNDKAGSSTNVANYYNPARFYAGSSLTIAYENMIKIVVTCDSSARATNLVNSITSGTATVSGSVVTIELTEATDSYFIESLSAQVRVASIDIYTAEAEEEVKAFTVGENTYATLAEAYEAAADGDTITMTADVIGAGQVIDKDITIDFGGYTYTIVGEKADGLVGSSGTETLGLQILTGHTVVLQNGTIAVATDACKMLIQNYSNLTLSDITLDGTGSANMLYVLSNNCGTSSIEGATNITAPEGAVAFDVYDYSSAGYAVPTVYVSTTGTITGAIEVSETATLSISSGNFTEEVDLAWCAACCAPDVNADGTYSVDYHGWINETTTTTVSAGETVHYGTYCIGYSMVISQGDAVIESIDEIESNASTGYREYYLFSITNDTEADAEYTVTLAAPYGTYENPMPLVIGENTAYTEAGAWDYYYFTYTADGDCDLTITMPEGNWQYQIDVACADGSRIDGDIQWSDSDSVVAETVLSLAEGDEVIVKVMTYDPDAWAAPEGTVTFTAAVAYCEGTEQNPAMIDWIWNDEYTEATASVTVAAGKTYYASSTIGYYDYGLGLYVDGVYVQDLAGSYWYPEVLAFTNDAEEEVTYSLTAKYPVGSSANPVELVIGENTAYTEAGAYDYYYFTYTAEEACKLTITMPEGNWQYQIDVACADGSRIDGDIQWSDSDSVVAETVLSLAEGDEVIVKVMTYDPDAWWEAPEGTVTFTAAFESTSVAVIGETKYTTVEEALKDASAMAMAAPETPVEVVMIKDSDESTATLVVDENVTLNIGAYTLTARGLIGVDGAYVIGDAETAAGVGGRLYVNNLVLSEDSAVNDKGQGVLPVWNGECYIFSAFIMNTTADGYGLAVDEEAGTISFKFKHQATGYVNQNLLIDGASDNALKIIVRLEWTNENGTAYQDFVYNDTQVGLVTGGYAYTFTLTGYENLNVDLDTLVINAAAIAESGAAVYGTAWDVDDI